MSTWLRSCSASNPDSDSDAGDYHSAHSSTTTPLVPQSATSDLSPTLPHRRLSAASTSIAQLTGDPTAVTTPSPSDPFTGIKNDFAELGDSIKELLSSSSNLAATGISSFASNFLRFKDAKAITEQDDDYEEEEGDDEMDKDVLDFARKVSMRPAIWTDFPISVDQDFDMSDSQRLHAATIEGLVPALASLRQEVSGHVSSGKFWLIYFIMLLPNLKEDDLTLLCNSKIVEGREKLLVYFQKMGNEAQGEEGTCSDAETVENNLAASTIQEVDKSGIDEATSNEGKSSDTRSLVEVSLSEVEDEEVEDGVLIDRVSGLRISESSRISTSGSESNEWIRLKKSSGAYGGKMKAAGSGSNIHGKDSDSEDLVEWLHVDDGTEVRR